MFTAIQGFVQDKCSANHPSAEFLCLHVPQQHMPAKRAMSFALQVCTSVGSKYLLGYAVIKNLTEVSLMRKPPWVLQPSMQLFCRQCSFPHGFFHVYFGSQLAPTSEGFRCCFKSFLWYLCERGCFTVSIT